MKKANGLTLPTIGDSCFNDHHIATRALVLHGLHKRKFPYALQYYLFFRLWIALRILQLDCRASLTSAVVSTRS